MQQKRGRLRKCFPTFFCLAAETFKKEPAASYFGEQQWMLKQLNIQQHPCERVWPFNNYRPDSYWSAPKGRLVSWTFQTIMQS